MKKGDKLKCTGSENSWLTTGNVYVVTAGKGDKGVWGPIFSNKGFEINDDEGEVIFQHGLHGLHGSFEVVR